MFNSFIAPTWQHKDMITQLISVQVKDGNVKTAESGTGRMTSLQHI